ncbi:tripartite motif-containing protein 45-like [Ostrea edulis]|uniref:tripartite motif-containing protein 45-like n=1 Tax=Ostrea edulis TaxID=37623 RepID=UPI0024AED483|nr:tripartite motif-containing protein 45-like [Ostrea edulis]
MATVTSNTHSDMTVCSICLERYKSPRYLPCTHTFCHPCLLSHIKSSCAHCSLPLGFPCPLCRTFVSAPGNVGQFTSEEWADRFPENRFMSSVTNKCEPCNIDGDDKPASGWCRDCSEALCEECLQWHKKFKPSRNHEIVPFTEGAIPSTSTSSLDMCEDHEGRKIEMFCESHLAPCCVLCVTTEHGKCKSICSIEEATDKVIKPGKVKRLRDDVDRLEVMLEKVITEERANIQEIEDVADKLGEEISGAKAAIIETVTKLEEQHLNEVGKATKDAKAKLQKSINNFEQRQCYLRHWKEIFGKNLLTDGSLKTIVALSYTKMERIFQTLREMEMSQLRFGIQAKIQDDVKKLMKLPLLAEITTNEHKSPVMLDEIDIENAEINVISEFTIDGASFTGGVYLQNGELVLADNINKKLVHCRTDGEILRKMPLRGSPWDICVNEENDIYVTLPKKKKVLVISIDTFNTTKTVEVDIECRGIAQSGNTIALGSINVLEVLSADFRKCRSSSDVKGLYDVAVDMEENIIYSSYSKHKVWKQDREGNVLFTYSDTELQHPYGLTVDRIGNIYLNGNSSNNIHILSQTGKKLRILNDVREPQCIKFQENTHRFFVGEAGGRVKIFEFIA